MTSPPDRFLRISIVALLAAILTISAVASITQFFLKHYGTLSTAGWAALAVYAIVFATLIFYCAQPRGAASERQRVGWILGLTCLLKLALVAAWSHLPQRSDDLYFLQFVDRWALGGTEALRQLSREVHDYPIWTGRAWPFLYPLRILFPTHFVVATQLLNCVLSTALLGGIYYLTRNLVTRPLLPLAFAALSPVFYWSVLEYEYRFQGTLLILAAFASVRFFLRASAATRWRALLISALLGLTLFLLHLQRGLDFVIIALLVVTLVYAAWQQHFARPMLRLVLFALVLPVVIMLPISKAADNWFAKSDQGKLSAGFIVHRVGD